ncbi:MAG: hypothetical protein AAGE52_07050 [Myxococcota bacterium]
MSEALLAKWDVEQRPHEGLILVRMSGVFRDADMHEFDVAYRKATDQFAGKAHVVLADMRGLKTLNAALAEIFGASIGYARSRGVALCAHVSDETVARLQAARVARANSPDDDVTIDVASREEAEQLCREAWAKLKARTADTPLRDGLV